MHQTLGTQFYKIYTTGFKKQIGINLLIIDDFNNPLSPGDRLSRQKISRDTLELIDIMH